MYCLIAGGKLSDANSFGQAPMDVLESELIALVDTLGKERQVPNSRVSETWKIADMFPPPPWRAIPLPRISFHCHAAQHPASAGQNFKRLSRLV